MSFQSLLLRKVDRGDVHAEPFPYLIKRDVLDAAVYAPLTADFPDLFKGEHRSNSVNRHNIDFLSPQADAVFAKSPAWREFRDQLLSPVFLREFLELFHDEVVKIYPQMARTPRLVRDGHASAWLRKIYQLSKSFRETVYIQATFNLSGDGYAIGPHYDNPKKLAAGLFYLREADDQQSEGGDFLVIRKKDPASRRVFDRMKDTVEDPELEVAAALPYGANTFCFMFNGFNSLHAATRFVGHGRFRRFIYFDVGTFYRLF